MAKLVLDKPKPRLVLDEPPDFGMIAIPREKLPGVFDYNKQLDALLGDNNIEIEDTLPLDVRFDFGRIVGMTEKPDETKAKMENSLFYSIMFNQPPKVTFNLLDELNKIAFNKPIDVKKAMAEYGDYYLGSKNYVGAIKHGFRRAGAMMTKQLAGAAKIAGELTLPTPKAREKKVVFPNIRDWGAEQSEKLIGWSDMMLAAVEEYYRENKAEAIQITPGIGYWNTLREYITEPTNLVQGIVESSPLILEGILGTVFGGPTGAITTMSVPLSGEVYANARAEDTEVLPAMAQSILSGVGEAAIEQWTLSRKLGLMKNFKRLVADGLPKITWEGVKVFFRGTAEEGTQEFNRNFWRWIFTDRSQQWMENVKESMAAGGPMELAMAGVFSAAGAVGPTIAKEQQLDRIDKIQEAVEDEPTLIPEHKAEIQKELDIVREQVEQDQYPETPATEAITAPSKPAAVQKAAEAKITPAKAEGVEEGKIVFHGGQTKVTKFDAKKIGTGNKRADWGYGFYFGTEETTAKRFGKVVTEATLDYKKPYKIEALDPEQTQRFYDEFGVETGTFKQWVQGQTQEQYFKEMKSKGYDAVEVYDKGKLVEIVVFDADQIVTKPIAKAEPAKVATEEEVKLTKTEEAAIAKLEAEVEEPFEMVRVKDVGFVIKEKATGKEAAVIAKRKEAKATLAEFNKKERKIKITRRKPKLLTDKTTVGKLITEARALKESIKKAARAAREAFIIGKREGIEKVKAHYFELKAREKERKELKGRVNKAVKSIKSKIPTSVDFFYREAIETLQSGIDPSFRAKKTLRQREKTKEFLAREPEALKDMPVKLIKTLQKKSIGEYTVAELEQIATEIEKLKKLGKLKRNLKLQKRQREIEEVRGEIEKNISKGESIKAKKEPVVYSTTREGFVKTAWEKTKAWTWRPSRIFDMLDGGKKFAGKAHQFFIDQVNRATNAKLRMVDKRKNAGVEKMESLGVTFRGLTFVRTIDDVKYTVDEMIGIYNANKNRLAKLAIMYGNNLTENNIKNITDSLTEAEKAWGDYIVQDYNNNYERLRQEVIRVENRDMGFEENYTPMRRTEVDYTTHTQEIIDEILQKESLRKAYAEHGFTIKRKEVPAEFQKPIRLNATSTWLSQIAKQEQYIHFAQLVKDMHKVASEISESVEQKFGKEFNKVIRNYIDRVANPNIYKSYNSLENLSRKLRQNAVIAYLAYNLVTMAKQIPSVFLYLQDAGPVYLLSSAMEFSTHPIDMVKMVREKDPQVKHRSIERELEEMKTNQPERYWAIVNKFGKAGMEGLYLFDAVARTIGWNAVYQKALKSDKSEVEAVRLAQNATLRTQPAAAAKDLAQLYATNEFANWFTMFTNQLNQIYNIATYDFTGYVKNAEYQKAALTLTGLSITALTIWIITNRRLPEDAEDFADAMGEQAINAVPLIGKALMAGKRGWGGTEIPAFELPKAAGRSIAAVVEGEFNDKDLKAIAEGVAVISGIPFVGPKRVIKVAEMGELKEIIGGEPIENTTTGPQRKKIKRSE